ncbi:MAG: hypothetical protein QOJ29_4888 [Thermoleophilaceae bacterium]|jgi:hypothetical protein|nr:hypothetical protein [Thermoleophilaceae bacterium]
MVATVVCRAALILGATALITSCGARHPTSSTFADDVHGLTVTLPDGWQPARESLTPNLSDPREELTVTTFAAHYRKGNCAHMPSSALEDMPTDGALVTLMERGLTPNSTWPGFPARPDHFGPSLGGRSEAGACVPGSTFTDHWFGFTDNGRHFHVDVVFGADATPETKAEAWAILDSLKVDGAVAPDWEATP